MSPIALVICPIGITMPKGLYFAALVYLLSSFLTFNLWGHRIDLNQTWTHIHLWLLFEKFGSNSPVIYPLWAGCKKRFFGTNFELWLNISLQRNMISTIGKKLVTLQGLPNIPKFCRFWSRNGWERLVSFRQPPKFSHWETLPA